MKYIRIIIGILVLITLITLITIAVLRPDRQVIPDDTVVIINGIPITRRDIQNFYSNNTHHAGNQDVIAEIITKQLLIAEAQKQGIDQEADFRQSLKNFYEHSLIKLLMERVEKTISVDVTNEEVQNYLNAFGKTYTFYTLKTSQNLTPAEIQQKGKRYSKLFDNLSTSFQRVLASLHPGESSVFLLTGNERVTLFLQSVSGKSSPPDNMDSSLIREELHQAKVETELNNWTEQLRRQASITYTTGE